MIAKYAKQITLGAKVIHFGDPHTVTRITRNYKTDKITITFEDKSTITVSPDYLVEMQSA